MNKYPELKVALAVDLAIDLLASTFAERGVLDPLQAAENIVNEMSSVRLFSFLLNVGYVYDKNLSQWVFKGASSWLQQEQKFPFLPLSWSIALYKILYSWRRWMSRIVRIISLSMRYGWK